MTPAMTSRVVLPMLQLLRINARMGRDDTDTKNTLEEAWTIFGLTHVPYRLLLLSKMIDRLTTRHVRKLAGLSLAEWRVVAHLAVMGDATSSKLSKTAMVDPAEISRSVRSLAANGLLLRVPDPDDQRVTLLSLTEEGYDIYRRTHKARSDFFAEVTQDLEKDELLQLDDYIYRMAKTVDRMLPDDM